MKAWRFFFRFIFAIVVLLVFSFVTQAQTVTVVHGIQLMWSAPAPSSIPIASYNVYRSAVSGAGYVKIGNVKVGSGLFLDTTGIPGTDYFYVVTGVDATGTNESGYSNQASAIFPTAALPAPATPPNLRALVK